MSKTTNQFAPEVRELAVRMVIERERDHPSRWAAVVSIAEKIGCVPQTFHEWVKKAEVDSGKRAGVPSEVADKMKVLEREVLELRQANELEWVDWFNHRRLLEPIGNIPPSEAEEQYHAAADNIDMAA